MHVWVPHLTPNPENVIGDWVFRCPAVISGNRAWIVDVDDVAKSPGVWLAFDGKQVRSGRGYRHDGHVFFVRTGSEPADVHIHAIECDRSNPFGTVSRWVWNRWGRRTSVNLAPYLDHVVKFAFSNDGWGETVWQDVDSNMGAPVFIVHTKQHPSVPANEHTWREPRAIWNQAWFSTQRCANGLLRHARRIGSKDLEARARKMTEVALAAPQDSDGLFPSVLRAHDGGWDWTNSDRRPSSVGPETVHLLDAAFTCRMLLEWHALTNDARALERARRFVRGVVKLQSPSGGFPAWIGAQELADGPESAVIATLLWEMGERDAAMKTLPLLESIANASRWEDFETFYSCARWGTPGERCNGIYKQNTLSIFWCAEAFFRLGRRDLALRCIEELSLYQAIWDPPFLPAPSFGGFGVMNADAEWNDARQSLFAPLYLEMGEALGNPELTERGLAALQASFHMMYCPENPALRRAYEERFPFFGEESFGFMMENQGHDPAQPIGNFTIFTWGNGSALAAAATIRDRFPEHASACGL